MSLPAVSFSGPKKIPYPGGCVLEPAPYALEYLLIWPADITVKGQVFRNRQVFPFLQELLADPAKFDLTRADAEAARDLYLNLAGQALEAEGGQRAWLEREFRR
ncbi:hypothetical protein D3875_16905 [Deinococcus cavernae]|uniref:Uncharacterized protein n=1 Tax=Deinococcus cavernae TaxID=2320857 RepID=A0A418VA53_9DEIO|nr:hypothetical protein [Deinococcus cavernae]RJF72970.1 hypothetical protein D3875_16905 [Deinococcus cavernae]